MIINQRFGERRKGAQAVVSSQIRLKMKNKIKKLNYVCTCFYLYCVQKSVYVLLCTPCTTFEGSVGSKVHLQAVGLQHIWRNNFKD